MLIGLIDLMTRYSSIYLPNSRVVTLEPGGDALP